MCHNMSRLQGRELTGLWAHALSTYSCWICSSTYIQLTVTNMFTAHRVWLLTRVACDAMTVQQLVCFTKCSFIQAKQSTQLFSVECRHLIVSYLSINHSTCETLLVHLALKNLLFNAACSKQSVDIGMMALTITPHSRHCLCTTNQQPLFTFTVYHIIVFLTQQW